MTGLAFLPSFLNLMGLKILNVCSEYAMENFQAASDHWFQTVNISDLNQQVDNMQTLVLCNIGSLPDNFKFHREITFLLEVKDIELAKEDNLLPLLTLDSKV